MTVQELIDVLTAAVDRQDISPEDDVTIDRVCPATKTMEHVAVREFENADEWEQPEFATRTTLQLTARNYVVAIGMQK